MNNSLNAAQEDIMQTLQKPTMMLIGSFYKMPSDAQEFFENMLTIYEANPTKETAEMLFNKVRGKESPQAKKMWMAKASRNISNSIRNHVKEYYIDGMNAVPKGLPASGKVMECLGIVSRDEVNTLMDAQAATRILSNLKRPQRFIKIEGNPYETVLNPMPFLNGPTARQSQRMEDLSKLYIATEHRNSDIENKIFADSLNFDASRGDLATKAYESLPQKIQNSNVAKMLKAYALDTLTNVFKTIKNKELAKQIQSAVNAFGEYEHADVKEICSEIRKVLNKRFNTPSHENFSNPMRPLIEKRTAQILSSIQLQHAHLSAYRRTRG